MQRRSVLTLPLAAALLPAQESGAAGPALIELRYFRMRSGPQAARTTEYLRQGWLPASRRAGVGPVGFFNAVVAPESPFILSLASFPSLAAFAELPRALAADKEFQLALEEYNREPGYQRMDNALLLAFPSVPSVAPPPVEQGRALRVFELRTYESPTDTTLARKVKMFGDGEIAAFRRCGMLPVFFGTTVMGRNLPSLTYMLAFDDLAARDKAWSAFGKDPGWQKLRVTPGLSDAEIVSNITNAILRPLPFSPIR